MPRVSDFGQGASPQGSNITAARTVKVKTFVTHLGPNKYATTSSPAGAARQGKSRYR